MHSKNSSSVRAVRCVMLRATAAASALPDSCKPRLVMQVFRDRARAEIKLPPRLSPSLPPPKCTSSCYFKAVSAASLCCTPAQHAHGQRLVHVILPRPIIIWLAICAAGAAQQHVLSSNLEEKIERTRQRQVEPCPGCTAGDIGARKSDTRGTGCKQNVAQHVAR